MRQGDAWDVVNIFEANREGSLPRLSSMRFGQDLMSYSLYQDALVNTLSETH